MEKKGIFYKIVCLDASEACQDTDVPTKIIKENVDIFTDFVHPSIIMLLPIMKIFHHCECDICLYERLQKLKK